MPHASSFHAYIALVSKVEIRNNTIVIVSKVFIISCNVKLAPSPVTLGWYPEVIISC